MHRTLTIAVTVLALAACGEEKKEPVTADEVIAQAGELEKPRPGQYETKVEVVDLRIPGLPAAQAERMKSMMGNVSAQANTYCLTQQEADKGFEDSIRKMTEGTGGMKCEFKDFDVDGGRLGAALTCSGQQGISADIALDGTASAEASAMRMEMTQKAAMIPGGEMRMEMKMESKRVGDCP
jgi:hypothetical protein